MLVVRALRWNWPRRHSKALFGDRPRRTHRVRATPTSLVPHQTHRPPNAGRSTNSTRFSPSDHNGPSQPPQSSRGALPRICTRSGKPTSSSTPITSTSPSPNKNSQTRTGLSSTGILQSNDCLKHRFWRISRVQPGTLTPPTPNSNA